MLQLRQIFVDRPVMSLRTGSKIAMANELIINPNNLKIEGWYCHELVNKKKQLILLAKEVRDVIGQGIVVNDHEALSEPSELIRLQKILEINFQLLGKPVITANGQKLGKVNDFAVDVSSLYIQKLYVSQSLLKNITGTSLSIDRSQIVEITSKKIVVSEPTVTDKAVAPATAPAA